MNGKRGLATVIVAVAALAALVVGVRWWLFARTHVETDDAYVRADVAAVTPRVSGTIQEILVDANWQVEKDQVLEKLRSLDVLSMSPLDAQRILYELNQEAKDVN